MNNPEDYAVGDLVQFYGSKVGVIIGKLVDEFAPYTTRSLPPRYHVKTLVGLENGFTPYKRKHVYAHITSYTFKPVPPAIIAKMRFEGMLDNGNEIG